MASSRKNNAAPAGYSGTPLPKKLGIKEGRTVGVMGAPKDFDETLGQLPDGAVLRRNPRRPNDLVLWFTPSRKGLQTGLQRALAVMGEAGMWIMWPKKSGDIASDLSEDDVRRAGLANGLVDYKVCAVDHDWSGLKFARRKKR